MPLEFGHWYCSLRPLQFRGRRSGAAAPRLISLITKKPLTRSRSVVPVILGMVLVLFTAMAGCRRDAGPSDSMKGKARGHNVLLITLDTTRADRIGCYGHVPARTPALDELAARGVLFDRAMAQVPLTLPSHATILTGRYPREHGLRVNGQGALPPSVPSIATVLQSQGYRTGAVVAAYVLHSVFGLDQGFDSYEDRVDPTATDPWGLSAERRADAVTDRALQWLNQKSEQPFFCWIHYFDPHDPYEPPEPYASLLADPYDGEIAFMDSQIRRVLDWLEQNNEAERTLIVVVGDHGESFGEHREFGHTTFLYQTNLHIPLIVVHPLLIPQGRRIQTVVETTDLVPTMLDLLGWADKLNTPGASLLPLLAGQTAEPRSAYAESEYGFYSLGWAQQRSLTTDRWKYILSAKPELFDLRDDPGELRNLVSTEPAVASRMRDALATRYASMTAGTASGVELQEESRRRLESLGYVSPGARPGDDLLITEGLEDPKDRYHVFEKMRVAQGYAEQERWAEALPLLEECVRESPNSYMLSELLGRYYEKLGRTNEAIRAMKDALKANPQSIATLSKVGELLLSAERYAEAAEHLSAALVVKEGSARTNMLYARALRALGSHEEAVRVARRAESILGDNGWIQNELGLTLIAAGLIDDAQRAFEKAITLRDDQVEPHYNLGVIAYRKGQLAEALRHFERFMELAPDDPRCVRPLFELYLRSGQSMKLARLLEQALQSEPDHLVYLYQLARLRAASRDPSVRNGQRAVEVATRAVEVSNYSEPEVLAVLGAAYAERGDFDLAVQFAENALTLAEHAGRADLAAHIRRQIGQFQAGEPFRESDF
jgi:arylsulfatase A-like enzyme/Tfp pilus assembly protein PilF